MFNWSGKNGDKSGKSQGIMKSCVSGNPACAGRDCMAARMPAVTAVWVDSAIDLDRESAMFVTTFIVQCHSRW